MKHIVLAALTISFAGMPLAQTVNFDSDVPGSPPSGWQCGVTGTGKPKWTVERESGAPSAPNVLRQSGSGDYPWCVKSDSTTADGFVEVRFKPIAGREDRAGGVVWRWQDGGHYFVARANALENNVSLYYTAGGVRKTLKYVDAPVPANVWHLLRVEFKAKRIKVSLDGKLAIDLEDAHNGAPGAVGVWTKTDSVTEFDDFRYGSGAP